MLCSHAQERVIFQKFEKNEDTIAKNVQIIHDIKIRELVSHLN
jgi:hypothetical protein